MKLNILVNKYSFIVQLKISIYKVPWIKKAPEGADNTKGKYHCSVYRTNIMNLSLLN